MSYFGADAAPPPHPSDRETGRNGRTFHIHWFRRYRHHEWIPYAWWHRCRCGEERLEVQDV